MKVKNISEAWLEADKLIPTDYEYDSVRSAAAGYPIYYSTAGICAYICDLGDRLEVNTADGKSVNIWIEEEKPAEKNEEFPAIGDLNGAAVLQFAWMAVVEIAERQKKRAEACGWESKLLNASYEKWKARADALHDAGVKAEKQEKA